MCIYDADFSILDASVVAQLIGNWESRFLEGHIFRDTLI